MKKYILMIMLITIMLFICKEVDASNDYYYNLIDMNQVVYDSNKKTFYSPQLIDLKKNTNYTFVASSNFFGTVTNRFNYDIWFQLGVRMRRFKMADSVEEIVNYVHNENCGQFMYFFFFY